MEIIETGFVNPLDVVRQKKVKYSEYRYLLRTGKRIYGKGYFVCYMPFPRMLVKVGASKRLGGAVSRNRQKRLVREWVREKEFDGSFLILVVCLRKDFGVGIGPKKSLFKMLRSVVQDFADSAVVSN